MARIKFGAQLSNSEGTWEQIRDVTLAADRTRWNSIWTFDHMVPPMGALLPQFEHPQGENGATLEGWTMLAALAPLTKRIRLGNLVTANTFRNPALLAKMAVTTDIIANGRLELGIGAAWHQREHEAYGFPFGTTGERMDRLDEALQIIRLLFNATEPVTFKGKHYSLDRASFSPRSPQQPRLPIMVGGGGEKRTLRMVAKYADTTNLFANLMGTLDDVKRKLSILDDHCREAGRNPAEIRRTVSMIAKLVDDPSEAERHRNFIGQHLSPGERDALPIGSSQRIIDAVAPLVDLGFDEVILMGHPLDPTYFEQFDREVLAAFESTPVGVGAN